MLFFLPCYRNIHKDLLSYISYLGKSALLYIPLRECMSAPYGVRCFAPDKRAPLAPPLAAISRFCYPSGKPQIVVVSISYRISFDRLSPNDSRFFYPK